MYHRDSDEFIITLQWTSHQLLCLIRCYEHDIEVLNVSWIERAVILVGSSHWTEMRTITGQEMWSYSDLDAQMGSKAIDNSWFGML